MFGGDFYNASKHLESEMDNDPKLVRCVIEEYWDDYFKNRPLYSQKIEIMGKFLFGILIGIGITIFYPDIIPVVKDKFLDSGARDVIVDTLKEIK